MKINWYPIAGLIVLIFLWIIIAAVGWFVWDTIQPKIANTVKALEINSQL